MSFFLMEKETECLYNSRWVMIRYALLALALGGVILYSSFTGKGDAKAPEAGYIFGSLVFLLGIYFLRACIIDKPGIILSKTGIDFQHDGFFSWDMIDSFSVVHYSGDNSSSDLLFHFNWRSKVSIPVSMFEKEWEEVVELIKKWNTNPNFYYRGSSAK